MHVLIFGTFDRLHDGHRFVLRHALEQGDVSVVVARDANVRRIKGRLPEQNERERGEAIVKEYPSVKVVLGDAEDFLAPVRTVKPDLIVLGYDQQLPPDVAMSDLPCPVERLPAFRPEEFKSSLRREK